MTEPISRRDWIKLAGSAGASSLLPLSHTNGKDAVITATSTARSPNIGEIAPLSSTSEVFIPPRGRGFMKFSFDFPEPVVAFGEHRFGFLVYTSENTYGLDRSKMQVAVDGDTLHLTCSGFVWAGGQEQARGLLTASFRRDIGKIEW